MEYIVLSDRTRIWSSSFAFGQSAAAAVTGSYLRNVLKTPCILYPNTHNHTLILILFFDIIMEYIVVSDRTRIWPSSLSFGQSTVGHSVRSDHHSWTVEQWRCRFLPCPTRWTFRVQCDGGIVRQATFLQVPLSRKHRAHQRVVRRSGDIGGQSRHGL